MTIRSLAQAGYRQRSVPVDFFCLIETEDHQVPHLEWLPVNSLAEARAHAKRMLQEHQRPLAAHIFANNEQLDVLRP